MIEIRLFLQVKLISEYPVSNSLLESRAKMHIQNIQVILNCQLTHLALYKKPLQLQTNRPLKIQNTPSQTHFAFMTMGFMFRINSGGSYNLVAHFTITY